MDYKTLSIENSNQVIPRNMLLQINDTAQIYLPGSNEPIEVRRCGDFAHHAIYLPDQFDYILGKDSDKRMILVPMLKK